MVLDPIIIFILRAVGIILSNLFLKIRVKISSILQAVFFLNTIVSVIVIGGFLLIV